MKSTKRFPDWVYQAGIEPDPRFTLANERTFLAWVRTALAFIACGVALELISSNLHPNLRTAAALVLVIAGTILPVTAWADWSRTERSMRLGDPLPKSLLSIFVAGTVGVTGLLLTLAIVLR